VGNPRGSKRASERTGLVRTTTLILIFEGARISYSLDLPIHAAPVSLTAEDIGLVLVRKGEHFGAPGTVLGF